ncbi:MAG: lipocalin family protein [Flavobacterium sp.]|uniref:lipocalin family protein n=1 Tax=Flavobacterium sp. TaxID=239 RepID=UPI003263B99C
MKKSLLFLLAIVFVGCSHKVDISKIDTINGYWQISKVIDGEGNKKEYPINETYDYFQIKNKKGFHKKVLWQPDGTFLVNDLQEDLNIIVKKDDVVLDFSSKFGKHQDKLESISEEEMVIVSKEAVKFYYSKVILNSESKDGKKN